MHQTRSVLGASVLLGLAGVCSAQSFGVRSVDTHSLASPISASAAFFQSTAPGSGNFAPSPEAIAASSPNQYLGFDTYIAISTFPSFIFENCPILPPCEHNAANGDVSHIGGDPFAVPNQVRALWFMDPAGPQTMVESISNPLLQDQQAIFVGRFSFRNTSGSFPSETLSLGPEGLVIDIVDEGTQNVGSPATDSLLLRFNAFGADVSQGQDGGDLSIHPTANTYRLIEHVTLEGPLPGGTARWQIHDLYVVAVPSPAAGWLLAIGSMVASRRRRIEQGA